MMIDLNARVDELEFPQDTSLRIIASADEEPASVITAIETILSGAKVRFGAISHEPRKGGKFYRYYLKVTFDSLESMRGVNVKISKIPGVKAVL